jgi:hypothetical protein
VSLKAQAVTSAHALPSSSVAAPPTHAGSAATWPLAVALLAAVLLARLAYLIWLCPYDLAADEAYYWEQARHLDWCYNEKGPALAWIIAASCRLFGDTEWAVRLPMLVAFGLAAWGTGRLAMSVAGGDPRAGFFAVVCFCLIPAFQANAQLCTQDGPLIALWVALTAAGLRLFRRRRAGRRVWGEVLLLWALLGLGFLLKQSVLLFLPGVALFEWIERRRLRPGPTFILQHAVGAVVFVAMISPMIVWNQWHGWPMLAHTVGHLAGGGDQAGLVQKGNPLTWVLSTVGGIVGSVGPAALLLMLWAGRGAVRQRPADDQRRLDSLWLMCATWPAVLFFVALSFVKPVIPSWPLPSFGPLAALVGMLMAGQYSLAPSAGIRRAWGFLVVYGVGAWLLVSFPTPLRYLPFVGTRIDNSILKRISGHREAAADLQRVLDSLPQTAPSPRVVTRHYSQAVLYRFYLTGHPPVSTAGKYVGHRATTLDEWDDTRLDNPDLLGRSLLLVNVQGNVPRARSKILAKVAVPWEQALSFDALVPIDDGRFSLATNYRGPRSERPAAAAPGEDEP